MDLKVNRIASQEKKRLLNNHIDQVIVPKNFLKDWDDTGEHISMDLSGKKDKRNIFILSSKKIRLNNTNCYFIELILPDVV